ncbi:hypothetical protein O181_125286 [Austropuccinia psidii MF-1]|uniref:Uncharacterized protein n=1 Tax=Austropuccinia psidii MF-1 TaxID=1389203 RepID=A0A9Q3KS26_9BASI|nr:hypothetical protein [Austropuccinia psidii MF-1]
MPQILANSTEFHEQTTSAPESGSEISDMVSSHELGIEVESLAHESNPDPPVLPEFEHRFILNICSISKTDTFVIAFISAQPPSSQKPNFKSYEKDNTVEPCSPTKDARQYDVIFSGEVEIISKERFVSNIAQTIPRLTKTQNDSKIPYYVRQKLAEAISLLKMDLNSVEVGKLLPEGSLLVFGVPGKGLGKRPNINATKNTNKKVHTFGAAKDARDQGDDMINVEVDHIAHEPPHTESPPILNEKIHDETPPASPQNIQAFQERETIKHDTMGQDMTDIMPDPEPKVSSSANFQRIFLSPIEEFGDILNYRSNITQESWKRGLGNINSIYKNRWDNLPTNDSDTFLPIGTKVISNQELKMLTWLEELEIAGEFYLCA